MDIARLFADYTALFDSADKDNGSLYVFHSEGNADAARECIARLEDRGLWTRDIITAVRDDQRETYATQLETVELVSLSPGKDGLYAGRFNHPRFPSNKQRWQDWLACLRA